MKIHIRLTGCFRRRTFWGCIRSAAKRTYPTIENIPGNGQRDAGSRRRHQGSAKDGGAKMIRTSFKECRYCNERYPGCHDECTRYKAAKAEYDRQKQIASEKRIHEGEVVDYFKVSCCRKRGR